LFFAFRAPVIGITTFLKLDRPVSVGQSGLTTFACEDARFIMKITAARVIVTCPGRNFVTLKIETDQGVYGIGDGTLNGRELSVVAYLEEHVIPCLIGMDPRRIEDIWQYLYRGAYWRRGPVTMRAIAAVDMALWDIKAKMAGMPLYQLLGGRSRDGIMVYGHANGSDIAETVEAVGQYIDMGYKAIRAQTGVPGIKDAYGVGRGKLFYEPADAALPRSPGGTRARRSTTCPSCLKNCARPMVSTITCCTTGTTAIPRRKRPTWARCWSRSSCSGWKTAPRRKTRKRSSWCASTPPRRWPWARSSTRSGTPRT
jgi:hypothetical protein